MMPASLLGDTLGERTVEDAKPRHDWGRMPNYESTRCSR